MILIKINKGELPVEVMKSDSYIKLLNKSKELIIEIESNVLRLVKFETEYNKQIDIEFASTKGWECGIYLCGGWVKNVKL